MRKLFIFAFLANVLLSLASLAVLPDRVAVHFGWGGIANSWGPKAVLAIVFLAIEILLFITVLGTPSSILKFPPSMINLPNKDYWLKKENLPRTKEKLAVLMWEFGIALFAFFFLVEFLVLDANLSDPVRLKEELFLPGLIVFVLYAVYWCIKLYRSFKIPPGPKTR